jgi:putative oxidoreductase
MRALVSLHNSVFGALETAAPWLIPTLARLVFAGTLLIYFWNSGLTKWGAGPFSPDLGAYIQILPRAFDAVGYDPSALGPLAKATCSSAPGRSSSCPRWSSSACSPASPRSA